MTTSFPNRLPASRLGQAHDTLDSFHNAVTNDRKITRSKQYTLIVVTEEPGRILLGMKNRGFGKGMFNSFGGKFDSPDEGVEDCACRELWEETNITMKRLDMSRNKVGTLRFTFDEDPVEMIVHLFWLHFPKGDERLQNIQACDEITPQWFNDWKLIPLNNMFADDSLWLPTLLSSTSRGGHNIKVNGWYHFAKNAQETNTIRHYYMEVDKPNLERRLFNALHSNQIHSPSIKEFKEGFAFCNAVRSHFDKAQKKQKNNKADFDLVIDVAGGHGALAALFLMTSPAKKAVVIDPAQVGNNGVQRAWGTFWGDKKELIYRYESLRTGLPSELKTALKFTRRDKILVVACHACQHLSEEILEIACDYGVSSAVMPCCQKDLVGSWKSISKNLGIRFEYFMDILLAGKMMGRGTHEVRMKCLDSKITPQNRIILCRGLTKEDQDLSKQDYERNVQKAHVKLEIAYRRAHVLSSVNDPDSTSSLAITRFAPALGYTALGFVMGLGAASFIRNPR